MAMMINNHDVSAMRLENVNVVFIMMSIQGRSNYIKISEWISKVYNVHGLDNDALVCLNCQSHYDQITLRYVYIINV